MKTIVLVACCGQKLAQSAQAGELYRSDLFLKAKAYAESIGAQWFILSAKHGLVQPGHIIEPYDETLNTKTAAELADWNAMVRRHWGIVTCEGSAYAREGVRLIVLAGAKYRGWLDGIEHDAPMAGMGIGQQKAWLKAQVGAPMPEVARLCENCFQNGGGRAQVRKASGELVYGCAKLSEALRFAFDEQMVLYRAKRRDGRFEWRVVKATGSAS